MPNHFLPQCMVSNNFYHNPCWNAWYQNIFTTVPNHFLPHWWCQIIFLYQSMVPNHLFAPLHDAKSFHIYFNAWWQIIYFPQCITNFFPQCQFIFLQQCMVPNFLIDRIHGTKWISITMHGAKSFFATVHGVIPFFAAMRLPIYKEYLNYFLCFNVCMNC